MPKRKSTCDPIENEEWSRSRCPLPSSSSAAWNTENQNNTDNPAQSSSYHELPKRSMLNAADSGGRGAQQDSISVESSSLNSLLSSTSGGQQQQQKRPKIVTSWSSLAEAAAAAKDSNQNHFSQKLKGLNKAFVASCLSSVSVDPACSLVPLLKDYLHHTATLMVKQDPAGNGDIEKTFKVLGQFFNNFEENYVHPKLKVYQDAMETEMKENDEPRPPPLPIAPPPQLRAKVTASYGLPVAASSPPTIPGLVTALHQPAEEFSFLRPRTPPPIPMLSSPPPLALASGSFSGTTAANPGFPLPILGMQPSHQYALLQSLNKGGNENDEKENDGGDGGGEEEEYQPPKDDTIVQVKEDNAVHSQRCKVYAMIGKEYKERGIGTLFVKEIEKEKYQMVVRAENKLGTVLLNILLQKSLPLEKKGANAIVTMDMLGSSNKKGGGGTNNNNDAKKGQWVLLKVKTEKDADELLAKLKGFQEGKVLRLEGEGAGNATAAASSASIPVPAAALPPVSSNNPLITRIKNRILTSFKKP